ncbi:MAG: HD domain-containing protein [Lachnospiraceae bacterium]|nr:HD domain-containing protein [Lachnospiraceae bacterium]
MERVEKVMNHETFKDIMKRIEVAETDRIFCRHGITHLLDVARILYILILEEKADIDKELAYATALLHDIGRYEQYENKVPHGDAGADIAGSILRDCGFSKEECELAINAIRVHSDDVGNGDVLTRLLYKADKLSRNCFECGAIADCYWNDDLKNYSIKY